MQLVTLFIFCPPSPLWHRIYAPLYLHRPRDASAAISTTTPPLLRSAPTVGALLLHLHLGPQLPRAFDRTGKQSKTTRTWLSGCVRNFHLESFFVSLYLMFGLYQHVLCSLSKISLFFPLCTICNEKRFCVTENVGFRFQSVMLQPSL